MRDDSVNGCPRWRQSKCLLHVERMEEDPLAIRSHCSAENSIPASALGRCYGLNQRTHVGFLVRKSPEAIGVVRDSVTLLSSV